MVVQLNGTWKVSNEGLQPLHREAQQLLKGFTSWKAGHVYRYTSSQPVSGCSRERVSSSSRERADRCARSTSARCMGLCGESLSVIHASQRLHTTCTIKHDIPSGWVAQQTSKGSLVRNTADAPAGGRNANGVADALANEAMDQRSSHGLKDMQVLMLVRCPWVCCWLWLTSCSAL